MSRLLNLLLLGLILGMMSGAMVHAAEAVSLPEVTSASQWPHSDGDHDETPADSHGNYPHHHTTCHGHDLAAPIKLVGVPAMPGIADTASPFSDHLTAAAPPGSPLRPPIA